MNPFVILIAVLFSLSFTDSCPAEAQEQEVAVSDKNSLANTDWSSSEIPFEKAEQSSYVFQRSGQEGGMTWGNFIHFEERMFNTEYRASCGNDCFTSVTGDYRLVGGDLLKIKVMGISRSSFCTKKPAEGFQFLAYYRLSMSEDGNTLMLKNCSSK